MFSLSAFQKSGRHMTSPNFSVPLVSRIDFMVKWWCALLQFKIHLKMLVTNNEIRVQHLHNEMKFLKVLVVKGRQLGRQCMYDITLWHSCITTVAVQMQQYILSVVLCYMSLSAI
jgi:hypothetical protein